MTTATLTRAQFLKAEERTQVASSAVLKARWGDSAGDTAQSSILVLAADAVAEAARQLALFAGVAAEDAVQLEGVFFDLEGETVRVSYAMADGGSFFGGTASVDILVTKSKVDLASGTTAINGVIVL